ncbi:hypothetical protein KSD_76180 [Ktedonobacter sp. SOSP1-85]|uniref:hypothetical protein n=1 Tax=Ktedonobacter sp. SOSP1-85 TaxID=2778367 RepID=UPI001916064F|nr:hypothetical protein [Ktedonobacter sp. SOSP1-85]GHO79847.1 hypothetical protein KSD_76180 [Ktedonobacter sp. SOSP1-85]
MNRLRTPFLFCAIVLICIVVLIEMGTALPGVLRSNPIPITAFQLPPQLSAATAGLNRDQQNMVAQLSSQGHPPGLGLPDLALLDSIMLFTVILMGVALFIPERLHGRVQGIATLIFSLLLMGFALRQIFIALSLLMLMISLLISIPFGTLIYLIVYGSFNRAGAYVVLSVIMLLKFGFSGSLFFAQQRFLESKGLLLLLLTSLLGTVLVSLLLGIVPAFLVSITDAIAALCIGIITIIWGITLLIGSITSIIKTVRLNRVLTA